MVQTYTCEVAGCGETFKREYEIKKHKATHDNPESVIRCPQCKFITLQKKNFTIHLALHTGEKAHQCPDNITPSPDSPPERCDYKTHDPAALSKHRKSVHGYVPPANRSRSRNPMEDEDGNATQLRRSPRGHAPPTPRPKRTPKNPKGGASASNSSPLRNEIIDVDAMDFEGYPVPFADPSGVLIDSDEEEMSLDTPFDPTLSAQWMARYEHGYSTGTYVPKPLRAASSSTLGGVEMDTRRDGCLCPEWMAEVGIEGWE